MKTELRACKHSVCRNTPHQNSPEISLMHRTRSDHLDPHQSPPQSVSQAYVRTQRLFFDGVGDNLRENTWNRITCLTYKQHRGEVEKLTKGMNPNFESRDVRRLIAWQKAQELTKQTYKLIKQLPPKEKYGICDQMSRCSTSVGANLAEGNSNAVDFPRKVINFYSIAKGSAFELLSWFDTCLRLEYIDPATFEKMTIETEEVIRLITALMRKVRNELNSTPSSLRSNRRTLDKPKVSTYSEAEQEGAKVHDDNLDFTVAVLQWLEQSKVEQMELLRQHDQLRMTTSDEGRFLPDVLREEAVRHRFRR